ncbi:hypothetical protein [Embleya sp. NPDC001921]
MRSARFRLAALAVATSVPLLLASACDSDAGTDDKGAKGVVTTGAAADGPGRSQSPGPFDPNGSGTAGAKSPSATPKPSSGGGSTGSAGRVLTQDQLSSVVVTRAEMNTGADYSKDVPNPRVLGGKETAERPECQPFVDLMLPGNGTPAPLAAIKAATSADPTPADPMPGRADIVELYAFGPGQAEDLFAKGRTALAACSTITTKDEQGTRTTMAYTRANGPALGDESFAATAQDPEAGASGLLLVRVGSHLVLVSTVDLESTKAIPPNQALARTQVSKLQAAVRS